MSGFRRFELLDHHLGFDHLDHSLNPIPPPDLPLQCLLPLPSPSDLIHLSPEPELYTRSLADRLAAIELGRGDREYKWTAEIEGDDRKWTWSAEARGGERGRFKWTAEVQGKGKNAPASRKYTFRSSTAGKVAVASGSAVEFERPDDRRVRQVFAKRAPCHARLKKELSPQDAALIIQMSFRAYLVRRSQVLRGLRELAIAKSKMKEIRALFSNFSYCHCIGNDAEECRRLAEKIVVVLLTVDAIEGADYMVRASKRTMVDELEAMLEVVAPQQARKLGWVRPRKFDLSAGGPFSKDMAWGVAEVAQMLEKEDSSRSSLLPDIYSRAAFFN